MAHGGWVRHTSRMRPTFERWADQRLAQADLPRLVRRLIRHENDQVQRVEMRGGEGVGLPGYDGIVEATRATSFVPGGLSVWEMGTSEDLAGKATDDYTSRTADPLGVDMASATFVFVTPRRRTCCLEASQPCERGQLRAAVGINGRRASAACGGGARRISPGRCRIGHWFRTAPSQALSRPRRFMARQ
jgi:hypothetical protein